MTPDDVRAAAKILVEMHQEYAPLFGKAEAQLHAYDYLKGLLICPERKSIEPIALLVGHGDVSGLQKFVNSAPWPDDDVQAAIQGDFARHLAPSAVGTRTGTVGIVDESGFTKKGRPSAGVAVQHNGRLDKQDNCQVGVFLVGVTPAGVALLDQRLSLPEGWCGDTAEARQRREGVHIPPDVAFRTKPQLAAELIRNVIVLGEAPLAWITADEEYGKNGEFLDELEALEQRYVVEVPKNTTVWTVDPAGRVGRNRGLPTVAEVAASLAASAWRRLAVRSGAKGPLCFEFAAVRVWAVRHRRPGPPTWLVIRRSLEAEPEIKYYVSNAEAETPLGVMAQVACTRHEVEVSFEDAKGYLGMAQYETRSWVGWHHQMSLVALAHLFVTRARLALKKTTIRNTAKMTAIPGSAAPDLQGVPAVASSIVPSS
jgi:SRSO17 transposase